ncbi:hypothetical protein [uncultured Paraglaciecola sp.]|uniref:hypothetical protein n=1 Tax=uncultured Paraglaciecola sp. TaxID=1765024 RepID=UPI00262382BF|nr:hypothetical protein [uncultured Paraglaciecola sp.]
MKMMNIQLPTGKLSYVMKDSVRFESLEKMQRHLDNPVRDKRENYIVMTKKQRSEFVDYVLKHMNHKTAPEIADDLYDTDITGNKT